MKIIFFIRTTRGHSGGIFCHDLRQFIYLLLQKQLLVMMIIMFMPITAFAFNDSKWCGNREEIINKLASYNEHLADATKIDSSVLGEIYWSDKGKFTILLTNLVGPHRSCVIAYGEGMKSTDGVLQMLRDTINEKSEKEL